jgi:hypothetical protein
VRAYLYRLCVVWAFLFANTAFWGFGATAERMNQRADFALTCAVLAIALRKEAP